MTEGQAPDFIKKLQNQKGPLGGEVSFTVEFNGKPKPDVLWSVYLCFGTVYVCARVLACPVFVCMCVCVCVCLCVCVSKQVGEWVSK